MHSRNKIFLFTLSVDYRLSFCHVIMVDKSIDIIHSTARLINDIYDALFSKYNILSYKLNLIQTSYRVVALIKS